MSFLRRIFNSLRNRLRPSLDADIAEELQSHFDLAQAEGRDAHATNRAFGNRLVAHESIRDAVLLPRLESILADLRFALRQLAKHKTASAVAILSLALGLGSATAAFRLIDALLLRPLPIDHPERLYALGENIVNIHGQFETATGDFQSYPAFQHLRDAVRDQADVMALSSPQTLEIAFAGAGPSTSSDSVERATFQSISGNTFGALGLTPVLGRLISGDDDAVPGRDAVAVLSYNYWTDRFARDPHIIGRSLETQNRIYQIIGVAPRGFTGTEPGFPIDLFRPTMMNAQNVTKPNWRWIRILAKLHPGVASATVTQRLHAAMQAERREQAKAFHPANSKIGEQWIRADMVLEPAGSGVSDLQSTYGRPLAILAGVVILVLLIACLNTGNLLLAHTLARGRELALRVSIGAGRGRLVQLILIESLLISFSAAALGISFSWWAAPFVTSRINYSGEQTSGGIQLSMPFDWRLAAFALAASCLVTLLFGLLPAWRASSVAPAGAAQK